MYCITTDQVPVAIGTTVGVIAAVVLVVLVVVGLVVFAVWKRKGSSRKGI